MKILLVDDESWFCRGMSKMIRSLELDIEIEIVGEAYDAEEAIHLCLSTNPDVVITDIRMQGMNGLQLVETLSAMKKDVIFVVLSAYSDFQYARWAIRLDVEDYLLKPVTRADLLDLMTRLQAKLEGNGRNDSGQIAPVTGSRDDIIDEIEHYLLKHYAETMTLRDLSRQFGLVPNYLSSLFKRKKGISPGEYVTQLRVRIAKEQICANPELLLKQVADTVGYDDPLYFSRVFKKLVGISPSEYIQEVRK